MARMADTKKEVAIVYSERSDQWMDLIGQNTNFEKKSFSFDNIPAIQNHIETR